MGLECLATDAVPCIECPYCNQGFCPSAVARDAIELLKEQEPTRVESVYYGTDMFKRYRCPTCKAFFDHKHNYCPNCGKKVKWE